jgi:hypothetical protein
MAEERKQTCGLGLAENSPLPGTLAEVVEAIGENLEAHMAALDPSNDDSRNELKAYEDLVAQHRDIAERLKAVAKQMAGYRDLPMGEHDQKALGNAEVTGAFETFVQREQKLLELLTDKIDRERKMLGRLDTNGDSAEAKNRIGV